MEQSLELVQTEKLVYAATLTHDARAAAGKYQRHLFNLLRDWWLFHRVTRVCNSTVNSGTSCQRLPFKAGSTFGPRSPRDRSLQSALKSMLGKTAWSV